MLKDLTSVSLVVINANPVLEPLNIVLHVALMLPDLISQIVIVWMVCMMMVLKIQNVTYVLSDVPLVKVMHITVELVTYQEKMQAEIAHVKPDIMKTETFVKDALLNVLLVN
jgi:hypothetical protein